MGLLDKVKKNEVILGFEDYCFLLRGQEKSGKDLRNGTLVLAEKGWTPIEQITTNDMVYGVDGKLHNVLGVFPQGKKQCYKLTFSDGTTAESSATHLWEVIERVQYKSKNTGLKNTVMKVRKVMELQEIIKVIKERGYKTHELYRFELPLLENPVEFKKAELPINPYLLGLLIGDGCLTVNNITFSNTEKDVIDKFKDIVYNDYGYEVVQYNGNNIQYIIKSGYQTNKLKQQLDDLGLLHKYSGEKFIPKQYLYSSIEQRKMLLQGLIDTDGNIKASGNPIFSSTSKQLCEDVAELARSLGAVCTWELDKREGKNDCYSINIMLKDNNIAVSSVKHAEKIINKCRMSKILVNIEETDIDDTTCLFVNAPRHLFIIKDYILTHNTTLYSDLVKEFYHDTSKGLLIPFEKGYSAISDINVFPITILPKTKIDGVERDGWDVFSDLVNELIETRETNGVKMVCIDTVDEFMKVAIEKVKRLSIIETGKPCKSINDCFGGYGRGRERLAVLIKEQTQKLRNAGYGVMYIGHTKYKTLKTKIDEVEYSILGSNLSEDYDKMIANDADIIMMITNEPKIVKGEIVGHERKLRLRSDGFYSAGSRFANVPETIECSAKAFIEAFKNAVKSASGIKDDKELIEKAQVQHQEILKENEEQLPDPQEKFKIVQAMKNKLNDLSLEQKKEFKELLSLHNFDFKEPNNNDLDSLKLLVDKFGLIV